MSCVMEIERGTVEEQLLRHAERQTKSLEDINTIARIFLALMVASIVIGVIAAFA